MKWLRPQIQLRALLVKTAISLRKYQHVRWSCRQAQAPRNLIYFRCSKYFHRRISYEPFRSPKALRAKHLAQLLHLPLLVRSWNVANNWRLVQTKPSVTVMPTNSRKDTFTNKYSSASSTKLTDLPR